MATPYNMRDLSFPTWVWTCASPIRRAESWPLDCQGSLQIIFFKILFSTFLPSYDKARGSMKISISTESASSTINTHTHYKHSPPPTHPHTQQCSDRKGSGSQTPQACFMVCPSLNSLQETYRLPGLLSKGQTHWPLLSLFPKHLHKIASKGLVCSKGGFSLFTDLYQWVANWVWIL